MKLLPILVLLLFAHGDFWEEKIPEKWSDAELVKLLTDSPWAQMIPPPAGQAMAVQVFFATAAPIEQAEQERERRYRLRHPKPGAEAGDLLVEEYRTWLAENRATQMVIAVGVGQAGAFSNEQEIKQMEEESILRVGRKKYKMTGHFPPSAGDPYLRLAFPRVATPSDKTITLELYIPGVSMGGRSTEFTIKDMLVHGKLEM